MNGEETAIQTISESSQLTGLQVMAQVNLIQQVMTSVMKNGEHFGVIPGTNKPTLLKAGAEKLCLTFRLAPTYKVERIEHGSGHREYIITTQLTHIPTGSVWGEGVGSCSTLEKKYRYRNEYKPTGKKVPREYWDNDRDQDAIGGKGYVAKKNDAGTWMIYEASGQQENPDLAEQYNTVLKMAKKRSLTDATLNACAASDIFTQDLDENFDEYSHSQPKQELKSQAQAEFEKQRGINQDQKNQDETPEQKAKRELGEQRAAIMNAMPKDIQEYFIGAKKTMKLGEWFKMVSDNNTDPELIRGWIKDHPLVEVMTDMPKQGEESMP